MIMATHHHHDDALWAKLHELELQLAAYKLLRAARGDDDDADGAGAGTTTPRGSTCRGRQYDAYMRRRDARRVAASAEREQQQQQAANSKVRQPRGGVRATPMSPRGALRCAARDTQEAGAGASATPRVAIAPAKRTAAAVPSIPSTPRRDGAAALLQLPRSRTVSGGAAGSPARSSSSQAQSHHQRRNSLGVLAEFGECATPRPFLKRGTGTGGAAAPVRLRATRVHDLPTIDVAAAITPRPLPLPQQQHTQALPCHVRSVSELPLDTAALAASPQARARKRWGSPERPAAMFTAADSHRDLSKGLKKLLSFVRKGGRSGGGCGGGEQPFPFPVPSPRGSGSWKPVSKGWSGCSHVDVPFDRASLQDGHRFPMTPAVGISG